MYQTSRYFSQICANELHSDAEIPRLLEIGPGVGSFLKDVYDHFPTLDYTGLEISPAMRLQSQATAKELLQTQKTPFNPGERLRFIQGEAHRIPCEANTFDMVISVQSFYFWHDLHPAIQEILRVLKPNGQIVLGLGDTKTLMALHETNERFTSYSREEIYQALQGRKKFGYLKSTAYRELVPRPRASTIKKAFLCVHGRKDAKYNVARTITQR